MVSTEGIWLNRRRKKEITSSSRLGSIFLFLSLSEKFGRTFNKPLRNVAFSSLGLELKVDLSKKRRVEIARFEKKGWWGRVKAVSRLWGCRVIKFLRMSKTQQS